MISIVNGKRSVLHLFECYGTMAKCFESENEKLRLTPGSVALIGM